MIRAGIRRVFHLSLRGKSRWERDVEDEIRLHLELRAEQLVMRGASIDDAYREAVRRFGPLDQSRARLLDAARHREQRMQRTEYLSDLRQDVSFALRTLARNKSWTVVTILTFALGIGATTAVFSVVSGMLLHPLPYPDADHVVLVDHQATQSSNKMGVDVSIVTSAPVVAAWRAQSHTFSALEPYSTSTVEMSDATPPVELTAGMIMPSFAQFAGVAPLRGRGLIAADTITRRSVVLGEGLWRTRMGGRDDVIGTKMRIDDSVYTIVGVMPGDLRLPGAAARSIDVWLPIDMGEERGYSVVGRLRGAVTPIAAARELDAIEQRVARGPQSGTHFTPRIRRPSEVVSFRDSLILLAAAVALVMLIACANVAHLLLARSASRSREMAVRTALGAGHGRLVRQLLTESMLLSIVGAAFGVGIGWLGLKTIVALAPRALASLANVRVDATTLGIAVGVTVVSAVVFGLLGGMQAAPNATHDALKTGATSASHSRRADRVRSLLVLSEMALSAMLLVGASMLIRSVINLQHTDPGYAPDGLYALRLTFPHSAASDSMRRDAVVRGLEERLRGASGLTSVARTNSPPGWFFFRIGALETQGEPPAPAGTTSFINGNTTEPSYFKTMGIRFIEGSTFDDTTAASHEVIVNEGYARKHWPRGGAIGHRLRIAYNGKGDWYTIVGVVNDVSTAGPMSDASAPMLYFAANDHQQKALLVRTNGVADRLTSLRSLVAAVDPRLIVDVESARQTAAASIAEPRFVMTLLMVFTGLALVLAAVGLYGVMAYGVAQRTREIGIRIALGSPSGRIARLVLVRGLALAVVGAAIGLGLSAWGTKLIASSLFGITRSDPASFLAGAVVLVVVALAACVIPTRRALAVDPVTAIRAD